MGVKYSQLVWDHSKQAGSHLVVMLALADACNQHGEGIAWPKQDTLAKMARVSVRQLQRLLADLERAGEVVQEQDGRGRGRRCIFRLTLGPAAEPGKGDIQGTNENLKGDIQGTEKATSRDGKGDIQGKRIIIHEPEENQNGNQKYSGAAAPGGRRDFVHDAFSEELGGKLTRGERRLLAVQLADIRTARTPTPAQAVLYVRWWAQAYPDTPFTVSCVSGKNWRPFWQSLERYYPTVASGDVADAGAARALLHYSGVMEKRLDVGEAAPQPPRPAIVVTDEDRAMMRRAAEHARAMEGGVHDDEAV